MMCFHLRHADHQVGFDDRAGKMKVGQLANSPGIADGAGLLVVQVFKRKPGIGQRLQDSGFDECLFGVANVSWAFAPAAQSAAAELKP